MGPKRYKCTPGPDAQILSESESESEPEYGCLLVKRQNDNHSPGHVTGGN